VHGAPRATGSACRCVLACIGGEELGGVEEVPERDDFAVETEPPEVELLVTETAAGGCSWSWLISSSSVERDLLLSARLSL
jgi:hypothetical protein